jgi:hypothetical protein
MIGQRLINQNNDSRQLMKASSWATFGVVALSDYLHGLGIPAKEVRFITEAQPNNYD